MKVLLDTNIIIDNFARRDEYAESLKILDSCENGLIEGFVSTVTVMDVMYILRKHLGAVKVRDAMQMLMQIVGLAPVLKGDINTALTGDFPDFEDAVQASCAARGNADYIVTRNVRDFAKSAVPAIPPEQMLRLIEKL